jgi:tRNA-splicing ligase RtcB
MKARDLKELHIPIQLAQVAGITIRDARKAKVIKKSDIRPTMIRLSENPHSFLEDEYFGELAVKLIEMRAQEPDYVPRNTLAPFKEWDGGVKTSPCIDPSVCTGRNVPPNKNNLCETCEQRIAWNESVQQMENSCALPISHRGALMPDAHLGYGLPIGGVLAVKNAVIPFAVGVDIACRMKMSVYPMSPIILNQERKKFRRILERETRFGMACSFHKKRDHPVMDEDWNINSTIRKNKDRAWVQLGTSGSGNHFVEFGALTIEEKNEIGLEPGRYLTLLSHSGSRGVGAAVAHHYSKQKSS